MKMHVARPLFLVLLLCASVARATEESTEDELSKPAVARPQVKCNKHESSRQSCQNFARFNIHSINNLINNHQNASYAYQAMGRYFDRDDVAYHGFSKFFKHVAHERRENTESLMTYLSKRGGYHSYKPIPDPKSTWSTVEDALLDTLAMEKYLQTATLDLHWDAQEKNDAHLQDYLESSHMNERVEFIKDVSVLATRVKRLSLLPVGIHMLDEELNNRDM